MRRSLAVLLTVLGLLPGAARALPGASDPSIVIGVVATQTGPGALAGQDMVDGFNLALRQLGGRFANQEVRVVPVDDQGSPDQAVAQVKRLLERERVDMVLTGVSTASLAAIAPLLLDQRLFVINLDMAPAAMAGAGCDPYFFDLAAPFDGPHEAAGMYLATERAGRVVVIGPDTGATDAAVAAFKRTFPGEVAEVLTPRHGQPVYEAEVARIRALRPDAVYSLLTGGMSVSFARAFDAAGLKAEIPLVTTAQAVERPTLPALGDAGMDVVSIATWSPDLDSIPNKRMSTEFENELGRPATTWVAQGYDAAFLLDSALRTTNGKTGDHEALRAGLRRAEFVSVRGRFRFNTNHFPVLTWYARKVTRDARGRFTHELRGPILKDWRDPGAAACPMRWVEEVPPPAPAKKP